MAILVAAVLAACGGNPDPLVSGTPPAQPSASAPTETSNTQQHPLEEATPEAGRERFEELGFSLLVPEGLSVERNAVPLEGQPGLELYTFYIQDDGPSGEDGSYFQLYGLIQYSIPETSWEELSQAQNDTQNYAYVQPVEFHGLQGYETQLTRERNNFIFLFLLDKRVLRIAVSEASVENLSLAKEILSTLEWLD